MQIPSTTSLDPAITGAMVQNQIDTAVAVKTLQAEKQQGQAAIEMIQGAIDINNQLASGHIDVKL